MAGIDGAGRRPVESDADAVAISHLIDRRGRCRLAFEPIADLARGVVCGYEAQARFPQAMSRERWAREAGEHGLERDLDAFVVGSVIAAREMLPDDCFLSFDLPIDRLLGERVQRVLRDAGRLDRLVVELAAGSAAVEERDLLEAIRRLRDDGATIAVDGVGNGHATLRQIAVLRPEFVKLDPRLVDDMHRDDAKFVIVDTLGHLASQLDAWVVAQGVTRIEELDALMRLRTPLAQGSLIGVRAKTLTSVGFPLASYVRERGGAATEPGVLVALLERPRAVEAETERAQLAALFAGDPGLLHLPLVDARRRPVGLLSRAAFERGERPVGELLVVSPAARVPEVAQRAVLRPPATRFDPAVCCDGRGRYIGLVRIERLVAALALAHEAEPVAAG
ncbi:EAL domain-containing protein [Conexibacter arvalis]|uniref:EAL domain-containing protein (Putative c-di-GMP-specific phosphodiesterase class I) n=1 Tax=Conexibacter arvalis TaxID=912552 RepID=A0A840IBU7_9ACTN|nr:EAL domain-containing protein (putative c-di-GMP-specific phosphodiesterase class I) [Conexibacter arvalis]